MIDYSLIAKKYGGYEDIAKKYGGTTKQPLYGSRAEMEQAMKQEQLKGATAEKLSKGLGLGFGTEVAKNTANVFAKPVAQFGVSAVEALSPLSKTAIYRKEGLAGKTSQKEYSLPLIGKFKSFQSEFEPTYQKAIDEPSALKAYGSVAWKGIAEPVLAGIQTGATAKGLVKATGAAKNITKSFQNTRNLKNALKATEEGLTKDVKVESIMKAGRPGGAVKKGVFRTIKPSYTKEDTKIANAVKDLKLGGNPIKNATKINKQISSFSEEKLKPYIRFNSKPLTEKDLLKLNNQIDAIKPDTILGADPTAKGVFGAVKQRIKDMIIGGVKDDESLYNLRIALDDIVEQESKGKIWDNTGRAAYQGIRKARQLMNKFLANRMPDPKVIENGLNYEHQMFKALERIATNPKNYKLVGTNLPQRLWNAIKFPLTVGGAAFGGTYGATRLLK